MTRREWLILAAASTLRAQSSLDTQGTAKDMLNQALEQLSERAPESEIQSALSLIEGALDEYPSFGDAYYYRQLCLKRLKRKEDRQKLDLAAADRYGSEAKQEKRDPFHLAVPRINENLGPVREKWALVVGISKFDKEKGATALQFADADATAFAELLRDPKAGRFPKGNVSLLTNKAATTPAIKAGLNHIASQAKPEDLVVVYMSTHGSPRSEDLRSVSYLMTYDTDVSSRDFIFGSALPMVEVSGILSNRCEAQRTVAIFDTCHSGGADPGQALAQDDLNRLREGAGRYVLSSCQPEQLAYEGEGHGYFTDALIRKIRDNKDCTPLKELFVGIQKDVSTAVQKKYRKDQQPLMAKSDDAADIVLGGTASSCAG